MACRRGSARPVPEYMAAKLSNPWRCHCGEMNLADRTACGYCDSAKWAVVERVMNLPRGHYMEWRHIFRQGDTCE
jgi:hypothetical protein